MALTPAQQATLKADILADPTLSSQPLNSDGAFAIAAAYDVIVTPTFYVWKTAVSQDDANAVFDWTRVDNLAVGKARIWEWMFKNSQNAMNPSSAGIRAGIAEVWKGTAADNTVRGNIFNICQRSANRVEKLFATGAGTTTTIDGVGPATMGFVGSLSYQDVMAARNS